MKIIKDAHDGQFYFDYLAFPQDIAKMIHRHLQSAVQARIGGMIWK
jgi:hypothetical protein